MSHRPSHIWICIYPVNFGLVLFCLLLPWNRPMLWLVYSVKMWEGACPRWRSVSQHTCQQHHRLRSLAKARHLPQGIVRPRVDLLVPSSYRLEVQKGDRLREGETPVARPASTT